MKYHLYGLVIETDFSFQTRLIEAPTDIPADVRFSISPGPIERAETGRRRFEMSGGRDEPVILCIDDYSDRVVLSIPGLVDYHVIHDREIVAELRMQVPDHLIEIHLLGLVSTFILERRGILALHASAAVIPAGAVAFLANNKGGKTSLAASFVRAGHALLTDDVLATRTGGGCVVGAPGYPSMRMWPEHAETLLGTGSRFNPAWPYSDKRRIPLEAIGSGGFCNELQPVAAFYIPDRSDAADAGIRIERAPMAEAFKMVLANGYIARIAVAAELSATRFDAVRQLVRTTPVYHLRYPDGVEHLAEVQQAVLEHASVVQEEVAS